MKFIIVLASLALMLTACAQQAPPNGVPPVNDLPPNQPPDTPSDALKFTECTEPRPEICTMEYNPVCAAVDTGIRCMTTPCPSSEYKTYATGCTACSDAKVYGWYPGACEVQRFVVCAETVTGFGAEEYARDVGGICVDACPEGFDIYTTQIGVQECIAHAGEQEIAQWHTCTRSSDECNCVKAYETTEGTEIQDAQYRCVPEQYAQRLLFRGGQDRLDENGVQSVAIA